MTTALVTSYTARFASPDFIERDKAQRLTFEVQYEGAIVAASTATLLLRDATNTIVLNSGAVVASDGSVYYDLLASSVPTTQPVSQRWLEDWSITFPDGQTHTFRRSAHLILRRLYPCVTVGNLTRRHHDLRQIAPQTLQGYIDDAWDTIILRLIEDGRYPQQIMTPEGLIEGHKALALARAFRDSMLGEAGKYVDLSKFWQAEYDNACVRWKFTIDYDEDNAPPSEQEEGQGESAVIFLGGM